MGMLPDRFSARAKFSALALLVLVFVWPHQLRAADKPHIVYILANDLGWDALAAKRVRVLGYGQRRYFTPEELALAKDAVGAAFATAARRELPILAKGPGKLR